jgi:hypothetical protein
MHIFSPPSQPPRLPSRPKPPIQQTFNSHHADSQETNNSNKDSLNSLLYGEDSRTAIVNVSEGSEFPLDYSKDQLRPSINNMSSNIDNADKKQILHQNSNTSSKPSIKPSLQPLSLTLPSISSISNKSTNPGNATDYGFNMTNNDDMNNNQNKINNRHINYNANNNSQNNENSKNGYNRFYVQLLENIQLDDQNVLQDLIDTLLNVRSENEKIKRQLWDRIDALSSIKSNKINEKDNNNNSNSNIATKKPDSLIYNSDLSNNELKQLLQEHRIYNKHLAKTVDDYQDTIDEILNAMVQSNNERANDLLNTMASGEQSIEEESDKMWEEWLQNALLMDKIMEFDKRVVSSLKGL